jgi:hypothetical protein
MSAVQTWLGRAGGCARCPSRLGATGNSCRLSRRFDPKATFLKRLELALGHEAANPAFAATDPLTSQLVPEAPAAVGPATLQEKQADLPGQPAVLLPAGPLRFWP